ncbi:MAG: saccharopine dehydrogenase [Marinilabiliales bacterium]|nr:MAG: saccharopine dehydrogenase [Marinilabiliales bacterium]
MDKVLILGAGMVVKPIVKYLLDKNYKVTVATRTRSKAEAMIGSHPGGSAIGWTVDDEAGLDRMISGHDITVSLLPWAWHPLVARYCIRHGKHLVTTSYVKPEMKALDMEARNAGIIILNELGLDPGIDHMSAMRIIDKVHDNGGKIEGFYSICGALPAPEAADNPFMYKFSWSPKGVVMAGNNDGCFLRNGAVVNVPTEELFRNPLKIDFPGVGQLEVYPNRDSLPYIGLYGIPETKTMFRGTFRHPGWCEIMDAMKQLGLLSVEKRDYSGMTYARFLAITAGVEQEGNIREAIAGYLKTGAEGLPVTALQWLGLFDDKPMERAVDSPFGIVSDMMIGRMMLDENERDMVAMQHIFLASYNGGKKEVIKSTMLDYGSPATDTSVARTVALPAAIGVEMILEGSINARGVQIPVIPEIYEPILNRLEDMGISLAEEYGLPESEFIGD